MWQQFVLPSPLALFLFLLLNGYIMCNIYNRNKENVYVCIRVFTPFSCSFAILTGNTKKHSSDKTLTKQEEEEEEKERLPKSSLVQTTKQKNKVGITRSRTSEKTFTIQYNKERQKFSCKKTVVLWCLGVLSASVLFWVSGCRSDRKDIKSRVS